MAGPAQGEVWCYVDKDFKGDCAKYTQNMPSFGKFNDKFTAMRVGPNTTAVLFTDAEYKGKSKNFFGDCAHIGADFTDKASSLVILPPKGTVVFFIDSYFRGKAHAFNSDVAHLGSLKLGDKFSSLLTDPSTSVQCFVDGDYKGKSIHYSGAVVSFGDFNDEFSSFRITK